MVSYLCGLNLLFVGCVLFINGLTFFNKIEMKEVIFINLFVGIISFIVACNFAFGKLANSETVYLGALTFLFSCTYLWVAFSQYTNSGFIAIGYYCLFVSITASFVTFKLFENADSTIDLWLRYSWASWTILWFLYYVHLVHRVTSPYLIGFITVIVGILSAWIPGYLILTGCLS